VAARAAGILRGVLERGCTTVGDACGADWCLSRALSEGLLSGPRLLYWGKALSQTGGHGDVRSPGQVALDNCTCCAGLGRVADGVDAVRAAARDELREGARHLKVMASGGVASPTDRIDSNQYSGAAGGCRGGRGCES
jgi:imidazolonepropionase-like amidohydrolase